MSSTEKQISYQTTNSYSTLNTLTNETKNAWLACHGLGYLSRYFIQYFKKLDEKYNYVVAPQAPSKYYQKTDFKHVGASWLTKEETQQETKNVLNYLDAIWEKELSQVHCNRLFLGYSQGVSVITRWIASRKIDFDKLIIHSGSIPKELKSEDFEHITGKVYLVYGTKDEYLTSERIKLETAFAEALFGEKLEIIPFEGKHIVNTELIKEISLI
ncbi:alpha/beta hydrolase [Mesonia sp. K7]|uniref:alpha/beta hydrolase n=1 Tax=Mesonia sp. K7 TaxID=2218606 RepID=UPI000DA95814|nr:esterase [Mesonia sp. K7]PZD78267.1 esterase [Mesonia sp. K7]